MTLQECSALEQHPGTRPEDIAIRCMAEVMRWHRDPESADYNGCDKPGEECAWCGEAERAIKEVLP